MQHSLLQLSITTLFIFYCQCNTPYYNSLSSLCISFIVSATFLTTTLYHHFVYLLLLMQHSLLQFSIITLFIFYCQCNIPYYNPLSSFCLSFVVSATLLTTTLYHHFVYLLLLVQHSLLQPSIIILFIFYCQCNTPHYNSLSSFCLSFCCQCNIPCIIILFTFYCQCYNSLSSFCLSFIVSATFLTTTLLLLMQHSLLSVSSICSPFIVSATILTTTLYHHFVSRLLLVQHSLLQLSIITFFIFYC